MVNATNISYQPAAAYQGEAINTPKQEPKTDQTQPKQAPAADTQHSDQQRSAKSQDSERGQKVDIVA